MVYSIGCSRLTDDEEPGYHCNYTGCAHAEFEQDLLLHCEGCGKRFCAEHSAKINELNVCDDCRRCEREYPCADGFRKCGDPAQFSCANCGNFLCAGDARGFSSYDPETGVGEVGIVCRGGCPTASVELPPCDVVSLAEPEPEWVNA